MPDLDAYADALYYAAQDGSDCLLDAWTQTPAEFRDELGFVMFVCRYIATRADSEALMATKH